MRILFVNNKTYRGHIDGGWWYFYLPLCDLGHEVYFYDTGHAPEKDLNKTIESFKPDLIFCMLTGDASIAPYEPWDALGAETKSGRTKTFNWFCDDTWRFDSFSKIACHTFTVCSTPERSHLTKYKKEGFDNIIVGNWHANSSFFSPTPMKERQYAASFIGALTPSRSVFFNNTMIPVEFLSGLTQEQLFSAHCTTQIGINLSVNDNDPAGKTQMKQRIFEIPAGGGALLTQYHPGIEEYYEIGKEIMTFKNESEFSVMAKELLSSDHLLAAVATAGHKRFIREHDSKIRLSRVLKEITTL